MRGGSFRKKLKGERRRKKVKDIDKDLLGRESGREKGREGGKYIKGEGGNGISYRENGRKKNGRRGRM